MKKDFLFLLLVLSGFCSEAQYTFKAVVVDEKALAIPGVAITLGKNLPLAASSQDGTFSFNYASQSFLLTFSHINFTSKTISVNGSLPDTIVLLSNNELLEETIVKAFERNLSASNTAAAITVLSKKALERFGTTSFVAAVNTVPGVKMDERSPGSYRLSIRGNLLRSTFGVRNVKVYWNGIPFTDASGNTYFNQIPVSSISNMEIIKGPSGSMYGSGTGGVVLLSSVSPASQKGKQLELQAAGGSYGLATGSISYQQSGIHASTFSLSHQQADGYRQHASMRRDVAHYTGNYRLTAKHSLGTNIFYSDLFYQTPGGLTATELADNPRQARPAAGMFKSAITQQAAIYLKTIYAGVSSSLLLNDGWKLTTGVYSSYTDFKNPTIRNYEKKYEKGIGGRTVLQYKSGIFTGTAGAELQQGFFYTTVYGNVAGRRDTLQFNADIQSRQANIFTQAGLDLKYGFALEAGLSYNDFFYDYQKQSRSSNIQDKSSFEPQLVPRVSLLKKVKANSFYVAVSKGYSVPTIDEVFAGNDVFNKTLKAEDAINYEIGTKAMIVKNKLWLDAAYYLLQLKNTIVSRRDAGGGDFYTNAGNTNQRGAEISVNYLPVNNNNQFIRQLKLSSSYTNINATFNNYQQGTAQFDGNKLTGTPPNVFVLNADILYANQIYINSSVSYTDRLPLNDANTFYAASYWLYMVKLGYKTTLGSSTEANFFLSSERSANNPYSLGNDLNAAGNRFFNPAAPQIISLGVICRFRMKAAALQP